MIAMIVNVNLNLSQNRTRTRFWVSNLTSFFISKKNVNYQMVSNGAVLLSKKIWFVIGP